MDAVTSLWNFLSRNNTQIEGSILFWFLYLMLIWGIRLIRIKSKNFGRYQAVVLFGVVLGLFIYGDGSVALLLTFAGLLAYTNMPFSRDNAALPPKKAD